jgi:hypothetical protein
LHTSLRKAVALIRLATEAGASTRRTDGPAGLADDRRQCNQLQIGPRLTTKAWRHLHRGPDRFLNGRIDLSPDVSSLQSDNHTAIYDVAARTVHLPNGRRLEAHSGLGDLMDDPRYIT